MDDDLTELERQLAASPDDADLARRYEAALLRAGQRDEVERRYRFKFQCDVDWLGMSPSSAGKDCRFCQQCEKDVHLVSTQEELEQRVREGACVAVLPGEVDALGFLLEDPTLTSAPGTQELCLVEGSPPIPEPPLAGMPAQLAPPPMAGKPARISPPPPEPEPGRLRRFFGGLLGGE